MLWAAFLTCFFGFMRSGEICSDSALPLDPAAGLSVNDLLVDNLEDPRWIRIRLRKSKTDPFSEGANIFIPRTNDDLCPVAALLAWLVRRGNSSGPLFRFASGANLTRDTFVRNLREVIQASGLDPHSFSGHSFRSGAATVASSQGISDANLKLLGRWKSNAYQRYIKTPGPELAALARSLSQQPSNRSLPLQGSSSSHERPSEPDYTGRQAGASASQ